MTTLYWIKITGSLIILIFILIILSAGIASNFSSIHGQYRPLPCPDECKFGWLDEEETIVTNFIVFYDKQNCFVDSTSKTLNFTG